MKVQDLFESLAYDKGNKAIIGSVKDWLAAVGATPKDVAAAYQAVKESQIYAKLLSAGLTDASSSGEKKNGTFRFKREDYLDFGMQGARYYVLGAMGQIRYDSDEIISHTRLSSLKPRVVPNNPEATLVKTYTQAMEEILKKYNAAVKAHVSRKADAVAAKKAKSLTNSTLNKMLTGFEPKLPHAARFKSLDFDLGKKHIYWVTQSTEAAESKSAAEQLASLMAEAGYPGWKIHVIIRDEYFGDDSPKTEWQTAKS